MPRRRRRGTGTVLKVSGCVVCGGICGPLNGDAKSWRCAGILSRQTRRERHLVEVIERESAKYSGPGKVDARALVVRLGKYGDVETALDLWGGGESARQLTEAGIKVTSAEMNRSLRDAHAFDAARNGYEAFTGPASKAPGTYDLVFADFCGGASEQQRRELQRLVAKCNKWLAVTLAPDHQRDESLAGQASAFTIPAWLVGVTGFRLAYICRYKRNNLGQRMWLAVLHRPVAPFHRHLDLQGIAHDLDHTGVGQWISRWMRENHNDVLLRDTCLMCGDLLPAKRYKRLYCGNKCILRAKYQKRQAPAECVCEFCGVTFLARKWRGRYPKTCGKNCRESLRYHLYRSVHPIEKCANCGSPFEKRVASQKTCSADCASLLKREYKRQWEARQPKVPVIASCVICGASFERGGNDKTCGPECSAALARRRRGERVIAKRAA